MSALLRLLLPRHLDWIADVADEVIDLADDVRRAKSRGWTDADDVRLADDCARVVEAIEVDDALRADLARGIRAAVLLVARAVPDAPRRRRARW